jgi:GT2 family glycosyltransferase
MTKVGPELSVIVCTHNRASDAIDCVERLLMSPQVERLQLLVVDNASTEENAKLLARRLVDPRVQLVSEPRPGLSHARNLGVSLARAEWVAYLDDDALPFADWAARALDIVSSASPKLGMVGGAVLPQWPRSGGEHGVAPARLGTRWRDLLSLVEADEETKGAAVPHVVGCNLLVRRDLLNELGGFSTELGRTPERLLGGEEIAIARAIAERGFEVRLDLALRVYHKIATERLSTRWIRRRAEAEGELLWKSAPTSMPKVLLSIPYLAVASTLRTLPSGKPRNYDHHVRLWHNLGFLKSALSTLRTRSDSLTGSRRRTTTHSN